jgi:hypothetical protein
MLKVLIATASTIVEDVGGKLKIGTSICRGCWKKTEEIRLAL